MFNVMYVTRKFIMKRVLFLLVVSILQYLKVSSNNFPTLVIYPIHAICKKVS